jgi:short-subunit dehydrogenase
MEKILFPVSSLQPERIAQVIKNKTILISGASYGIGSLIAETLSHHQLTLVLVARTEERLLQLQEQFKERACITFIFSADLRAEEQINSLLQYLIKQRIVIDIFINNAGKSIQRGLAASMDRFTDTQRCSATNYTGPVQVLLGILPGIIKHRGHIVNVSALNVLLPPTAGWSAYQSSKTAFDQWLRCMEPELKVNGVTVSHIYLPLVRTRMSMVNAYNRKRLAMSNTKAAQLIINCISTKKRISKPWWTGMVLFAAAIFPNLWYRLQVQHLKNRK